VGGPKHLTVDRRAIGTGEECEAAAVSCGVRTALLLNPKERLRELLPLRSDKLFLSTMFRKMVLLPFVDHDGPSSLPRRWSTKQVLLGC
jgi:hypothetical protein